MGSSLLKRIFSTVMGMATGLVLLSGNLQNYVRGATEFEGVAEDADLENGEYCINSEADLRKLTKLVNNGHATAEEISFILTKDLDLTEGGTYKHGYCDKLIYEGDRISGWCKAEVDENDGIKGWTEDSEDGESRYTPIGKNKEHPFTSLLNGNGHEIKVTMKVNADNEEADVYAGIFGYLGSGAEIKGLGVCEGSYIVAKGQKQVNAGGIAGVVDVEENDHRDAAVTACYNKGTVMAMGREASAGNENNAGGIAGKLLGYMGINRCYNVGEIVAEGGVSANAGGIVGQVFEDTEIVGCYNTGAVKAANASLGNSVGGMVGGIDGATVVGCYNTGVVTSVGSVGGIAGKAVSTEISGCYYLENIAERGAGDGGDTAGSMSADEMFDADFANELNESIGADIFEHVQGSTPAIKAQQTGF